MYDEDKAVEAIRDLPEEVRLHLSHVVRNGMCAVLASSRLGLDVEKAIFEFESKWGELGL
jgi:hypothetical protein